MRSVAVTLREPILRHRPAVTTSRADCHRSRQAANNSSACKNAPRVGRCLSAETCPRFSPLFINPQPGLAISCHSESCFDSLGTDQLQIISRLQRSFLSSQDVRDAAPIAAEGALDQPILRTLCQGQAGRMSGEPAHFCEVTDSHGHNRSLAREMPFRSAESERRRGNARAAQHNFGT